MEDKVIDWLLGRDNPSVRLLTLTTLLGKPKCDPEVKDAQKQIMLIGDVPAIIEFQQSEGNWGSPERFYNDKYRGTIWNLLFLAEMAADPSDQRVKKACEFVLNNSQDHLEGGFSYERSKKTGSGLPSGVIPCLTGNMVYALIKLGYLGDERVQHAIDWICKNQRTDDGDADAPAGGVYDRYEMCWGTHTCHMGAAKSFKALAAIPAETRSPVCIDKIKELSEYFLAHHIYKKSHHLDQIARPGWLKFGFPLMYQTDVLELLNLFVDLNIKDTRLAEALDLVKSKRLSDGRWKLENSFNGKMLVNIETKGQPSKWITLKAIRVLKHFAGWRA